MICGCNQKEKLTKEMLEYQNIVNTLKEKEIENKNLPCHLEIKLETSKNHELMYTFSLDQPSEEMYDVKALVISEKETKNSYPSIGILDDPLHLVPNQIDVKNNYAKGIILVGYLSTKKEPKNYHDTFRLYLNYKTEDGKNKTIYYEKKNHKRLLY